MYNFIIQKVSVFFVPYVNETLFWIVLKILISFIIYDIFFFREFSFLLNSKSSPSTFLAKPKTCYFLCFDFPFFPHNDFSALSGLKFIFASLIVDEK